MAEIPVSSTGLKVTGFQKRAKGYLRFSAFAGGNHQLRPLGGDNFVNSLERRVDILVLAVNPDKIPAQAFCHRTRGAGTKKRIQDNVVRV